LHQARFARARPAVHQDQPAAQRQLIQLPDFFVSSEKMTGIELGVWRQKFERAFHFYLKILRSKGKRSVHDNAHRQPENAQRKFVKLLLDESETFVRNIQPLIFVRLPDVSELVSVALLVVIPKKENF